MLLRTADHSEFVSVFFTYSTQIAFGERTLRFSDALFLRSPFPESMAATYFSFLSRKTNDYLCIASRFIPRAVLFLAISEGLALHNWRAVPLILITWSKIFSYYWERNRLQLCRWSGCGKSTKRARECTHTEFNYDVVAVTTIACVFTLSILTTIYLFAVDVFYGSITVLFIPLFRTFFLVRSLTFIVPCWPHFNWLNCDLPVPVCRSDYLEETGPRAEYHVGPDLEVCHGPCKAFRAGSNPALVKGPAVHAVSTNF